MVTLHTTACCSMPVVDITCAKYQSANITSLRVVQQKHSWSITHSHSITSHIFTSSRSSSWVHRGLLLGSRWTLHNLYNIGLSRVIIIQLEQLSTIEFVLLDYYYYSCGLSLFSFWNLPGSVDDQIVDPLQRGLVPRSRSHLLHLDRRWPPQGDSDNLSRGL